MARCFLACRTSNNHNVLVKSIICKGMVLNEWQACAMEWLLWGSWARFIYIINCSICEDVTLHIRRVNQLFLMELLGWQTEHIRVTDTQMWKPVHKFPLPGLGIDHQAYMLYIYYLSVDLSWAELCLTLADVVGPSRPMFIGASSWFWTVSLAAFLEPGEGFLLFKHVATRNFCSMGQVHGCTVTVPFTCLGQGFTNVLGECEKDIPPLDLSLPVWYLSQESFLQSCICSSIEPKAQLLILRPLQMSQMSQLQDWCSAVIKVCFLNVQYMTPTTIVVMLSYTTPLRERSYCFFNFDQ